MIVRMKLSSFPYLPSFYYYFWREIGVPVFS